MSEELIAGIADASGSTLVRVDDVTTMAIELADRLASELIEGEEAFCAAIEQRRELLSERVAAHAALELLGRDATAEPVDPVLVNDLAGLRSLVGRIDGAERLVESSREEARVRAGSASGLAVHPSSIRDAAADVLEARATMIERKMEVERLEAGPAQADSSDSDGPPLVQADVVAPRLFDGWRLTGDGEIQRSALAAGGTLVVAILVLILTGSPLALVLPAVAVCWTVVLAVRQRDDAYDEEITSRNLAGVALLADRAYGGAGLAEVVSSDHPERLAADQALSEAQDRLAYAEASWRSLVGPDADVDDVESVVQARDAQYGVSDSVVDDLPSLRAAAAHRSRLRAQWKLAWWVLDRPIPSVDTAVDALDRLEAEGVDQIVVAPRQVGGLTDEERARLDGLTAGRSEDELRAIAEQEFAVVIVADADGSITEEQVREETAQLPEDVRFVVVGPTE